MIPEVREFVLPGHKGPSRKVLESGYSPANPAMREIAYVLRQLWLQCDFTPIFLSIRST
jgi:hypothetical protein